jgi:hypothetical protein
VAFPRSNLLRLRKPSLVRGVLCSLFAFGISLRLAGFPDINALHGSSWQLPTAFLAAWSMVDTARCLRRKWSLYHAGVLILLYSELMILALVVVLSIYP